MRKVFFVKYYDKGSTVMAGDQIAEALRARGHEAWSVYPDDVRSVRDAILVFIKTSRWWHLARAKKNRNRTVLDVQDTVVFKRRIKNRFWFDGMIWKNRRQIEDFGRPGQKNRIIHHQWDPRYEPNRLDGTSLRIAYVGLARSFQLWGRLPGVDFFDDDYFRRALDYNCHLSVREPGREFLYKPNCKVSTARGLRGKPDHHARRERDRVCSARTIPTMSRRPTRRTCSPGSRERVPRSAAPNGRPGSKPCAGCANGPRSIG